MSASKLVVTADYSGVVKGAAKAEAANKKAANAAGGIDKSSKRAGKSAIDMGNSTEKMGKAFGKALIKVDLIKQALSMAGAAATKILSDITGASMTQREQKLAMSTDLITAGAKQAMPIATSAMDALGIASQGQRQAFVGGLAATGRKFSDQDLRLLVEAFTAGGEALFGKNGDELLRLLAGNVSAPRAIRTVADQRAGADSVLRSQDALQQIFNNYADRATQRVNADTGSAAEEGAKQLAWFKANNPFSGALLGVGDLFTGGAVSSVLSAGMGKNVGMGPGTEPLYQILDRYASELQKQRQPRLASQGDGSP